MSEPEFMGLKRYNIMGAGYNNTNWTQLKMRWCMSVFNSMLSIILSLEGVIEQTIMNIKSILAIMVQTMDDMSLRKVEELTLYIIEQNNKIEQLVKQNKNPTDEVELLKNQIK